MCVVAEYTPEEILALYGDRDVEFHVGELSYSVHMDSLRYRTFHHTLECYQCGLKGVVMRLEYSYHQRNEFRPHFNLYGVRDGVHVLMTKDHILPVSKGGSDDEDNLKTMCAPCNEKKGNKYVPANQDNESRLQPHRISRPEQGALLVAEEQPRYGGCHLAWL